MRELFAADPERFDRFHVEFDGLLYDYSKQRVTQHALNLLLVHAEKRQLREAIGHMFAGDPLNFTEQRSAWHVALRAGDQAPAVVHSVLERMAPIVDALRCGTWRGSTGKPITHVVNLGIGGSDLGPRLVVQALANRHSPIHVDFIAGLDPAEFNGVLANADAEQTLFIISSKSFGTTETLTNARAAMDWLRQALGNDSNLAPHLLAVTNRPKAALALGIPAEQCLPLPEWVGGRFSLWSAVGLPIACAIGMEGFTQLLAGANSVDRHFANAPLAQNIPVLMGLFGWWNVFALRATTHAILPYSYRLRELTAHLQQLEMESNGKSVDRAGKKVDYLTAPVMWGGAEPMGQHAFHQLLYQGTRTTPLDFILIAGGDDPRQCTLFENGLAQSAALMMGKTLDEAHAELLSTGHSAEEAKRLAPHLVCRGNQPSSTLLLPDLTPYSVGQLLALYEHKVYVQGVLWNINSFDQYGVEFGKQMANKLADQHDRPTDPSLDGSTCGLLRARRRMRGES